MVIDYTFAHTLKDLRLRRGLSQKELAERVGIPPNRISNYELGINLNPPLETLRRFCIALGCPAGVLLGLTSDMILSADELECTEHYRMLDPAGKDVVRAVLDSQLRRISGELPSDG